MRSLVVTIALLAGLGTAYAQYSPAGTPEDTGAAGGQTERQRPIPPATTGAAPTERREPSQSNAAGVKVPSPPTQDRIPESDAETQPRAH
jgi:hypothetical protein